MKIEKINLDESITSPFGLKSVQMDRLNHVVLVAGKNGSGKSRLLQLIKDQVNATPNKRSLDVINKNIKEYSIFITQQEVNIKNQTTQLKRIDLTQEQNYSILDSIKNNENNIASYKELIDDWSKELERAKNISFFPEKEDNVLVDFVPQSLILRDSYIITPHDLDMYANYIYNIGTKSISEGTIPSIEKIQKNWVNANTVTTDDLNITKEEKEKIFTEYEKLKKYIKLFLNTDLKRTKDGYPEIFKKRIGEAQLSNGQKILLQFCMALFAQEVSLENLIIFMDEPENHLHPAALIEVLEKITPHVKNGQVWIATHSVNVLAHFDPSCIWYIDNGEISYAGNVPHTVLEGLLGNEEEIEKLSHFLSLPAQMASNKFAYESLFYPNVIITGSDDHQVKQIHEIIKDKVTKGQKLKVLDFGIGKGRLLSTIYENERLRNSNATDWLDYYGYDLFDTHKDICIKVFEDIYGSLENKYFNEAKDMLIKHDENTFDIIVMCNVFHEIDPNDWINLFNSVTSPIKLLKDDGYLLIVEDQFLAVGEKAHAKGFIVYDELEFRKLFKIVAGDKYQSTDYRKDGRLKSHHIPKNCINRIDATSKKESLTILMQNSQDEIKKLRKVTDPTFKTGKLHGFWTQQLANASLALEGL
jgi:ABC-type cobalamin/Fe3+-siderophores transport system ATPase subunit